MDLRKMSPEITTINLKILAGIATVNCYLLKSGDNFILIDSGHASKRSEVLNQLEKGGCQPGDLKLILLTHGDSDHAGNCAYLRDKYGAQIAMHQGDSGMVTDGDMLFNRKANLLSRIISPFMGLGRSARFTPDFYVEDGYDLSPYGLDARVVHIPGHSLGSVGILTAEGDFFCGDLFANTKKPVRGGIIDDEAAAQASVEKLKKIDIKMVYPGHGNPFPWNLLAESNK
ncbi:MAG: MBL fold metallo-hydrolase [Methanobacteriaceae archaeon]|nr:MBL fold metallo-hydrolase [Methanobacteriaceae archaeon]